MLCKTLITTAAITLTTSLAFAETAAIKKDGKMEDVVTTDKVALTPAQSANYLTSIDSSAWLGSKVIGMPVYMAEKDERIGEVNNIVIEPNGKIAALVVGVGGFLGVGEKDVAVRFTAFKTAKDKDGNPKLSLDVTKEQLQQVSEVKMPTQTAY